MNIRGSVPWATSYLREPKSHSVIDEELALDPTTPQAQIVAKGQKDILYVTSLLMKNYTLV